MELQSQQKFRIESIDILRGIVMVIMALDHVRDYFHITSNVNNPLDLATTTPMLYFTRWITHFCAPVFIFLSGVSIYLQSQRKTKRELSSFLIKRGLWLIVVEFVIIAFGWSFNPFYNFIFAQVIWTIGLSMILLGLIIYLQYNIILILGLLIVFFHNLLDIPESSGEYKHTFILDLVHSARFSAYEYLPGHLILVVYPFLAWTGLMMICYCAGKWFTNTYSPEQRRKNLLLTGSLLILFFIIVRFMNVYGDPVKWHEEKNGLYTFFSFMDVNKYPPSLLYLCITMGPALLFLAFIENIKNNFTNAISVFGRVAFFYYIIHIYLVHLLSSIAFFTRGHSFEDATNLQGQFPFFFSKPGEGYNLIVVYLVWIFVILTLYPLCKKYDRYKMEHKEKWWLSYL